MKLIITLIAIIACLNSSLSDVKQKKEVALFGQFIKAQKSKQKGLNQRGLYFYIMAKKGPLGYPIKITNTKLKKMVLKNKKEKFLIKATTSTDTIIINEKKQKITTLSLVSADKITLANLSYSPNGKEPADRVPHKNQKDRKVRLGISKNGRRITPSVNINNVNDTFTNTAIFVGGAALIGAILLGK